MGVRMDLYHALRDGDTDRRVRAFAHLGMWLAAMTFIFSTVSHYFSDQSSLLVDLIGGVACTACATALKLVTA